MDSVCVSCICIYICVDSLLFGHVYRLHHKNVVSVFVPCCFCFRTVFQFFRHCLFTMFVHCVLPCFSVRVQCFRFFVNVFTPVFHTVLSPCLGNVHLPLSVVAACNIAFAPCNGELLRQPWPPGVAQQEDDPLCALGQWAMPGP